MICKYSIVTKIGKNFCGKAYEVEISPTFVSFFVVFYDRQNVVVDVVDIPFEEKIKKFKKILKSS